MCILLMYEQLCLCQLMNSCALLFAHDQQSLGLLKHSCAFVSSWITIYKEIYIFSHENIPFQYIRLALLCHDQYFVKGRTCFYMGSWAAVTKYLMHICTLQVLNNTISTCRGISLFTLYFWLYISKPIMCVMYLYIYVLHILRFLCCAEIHQAGQDKIPREEWIQVRIWISAKKQQKVSCGKAVFAARHPLPSFTSMVPA